MAAGDKSMLTQVTEEVLEFAKEIAEDIGSEYPQGFGMVEVSTKEVRTLVRKVLVGDNEPMEKYDGRNALEELALLEERNGLLVWGEVEAVLEDYGINIDDIRAQMMAQALAQPAAQATAAQPAQGAPVPARPPGEPVQW